MTISPFFEVTELRSHSVLAAPQKLRKPEWSKNTLSISVSEDSYFEIKTGALTNRSDFEVPYHFDFGIPKGFLNIWPFYYVLREPELQSRNKKKPAEFGALAGKSLNYF